MALDVRIAERAMAQRGVVTLEDLAELGLSAPGVRHRVTSGRLHRVHAGVFAVGLPSLTRGGHYMAAVLACGHDSGISHRSAAGWRALRRSGRPLVDVISSRRPGRRRPGIDAHTSSTLLERDFELVDGIRCTTVARTLLDIAAVEPRRVVERMFDQAEVLRLLDARQIDDVLARAGGHNGAGVLRAVRDEHVATCTLTRNDLEELFLAISDRSGLPRPAVNAWIAVGSTGYEADFLWRDLGLIAEVDGRDVHATRRAFEHDRRRDQRLMLAGYRVARFTWRQVQHDPATVAETMTALLAQAASSAGAAAALSSSRRRSASSSGREGAVESTNAVSAAAKPIGSS